MKRLNGLGIKVKVKEAEAFSREKKEKLWSLKRLRDHSPNVLLDTMVFLIGKNFSLRSGKEHHILQFDQLTLMPATKNEFKAPLH